MAVAAPRISFSRCSSVGRFEISVLSARSNAPAAAIGRVQSACTMATFQIGSTRVANFLRLVPPWRNLQRQAWMLQTQFELSNDRFRSRIQEHAFPSNGDNAPNVG